MGLTFTFTFMIKKTTPCSWYGTTGLVKINVSLLTNTLENGGIFHDDTYQ